MIVSLKNFLSETKEKTSFASEKRIVLRGKTIEVIEDISDGELDFAYIDGDHNFKRDNNRFNLLIFQDSGWWMDWGR